jgi:hypothetical protein
MGVGGDRGQKIVLQAAVQGRGTQAVRRARKPPARAARLTGSRAGAPAPFLVSLTTARVRSLRPCVRGGFWGNCVILHATQTPPTICYHSKNKAKQGDTVKATPAH